METTKIINDILSFAGSIVWAGAIMLVFSAWIGKIWADIWFQKERQLYETEIEEYKILIEEYIGMLRDSAESPVENYITQAQFDKESVLYQKLSETGLELMEAIIWLFPHQDELPKDEYDRKKVLEKRHENAVNKYNLFIRHLGKSAPFINRNIYYLFDRFRKESHHQILFFPDVRIRKHPDIIKAKSTECYANTDIINEHYQETMEKLRNYIISQKISE